jgi:RNA polymerase sigma-70 factor, ECF subfamily
MQRGTAAVERVFREEYGRLIASLVRRFGDIDIAEEAAGEALVAALEKWPESGVPPNPGGWLTTTAGNRAIDRIRREKQRDAKHQAAFMYHDDTPHEHTGPVEDDRLRLLFTCCHPALAPEARIALTLRLLGGLTVAEIAQAFLVPETTMAQRITRAKKKIAAAKVPYRVPEAADLPERLGGVLAVLFLVFNEGYLATGDGDPVRAGLTGEAIRLTRVLRQLLPEEPEVAGLLGLLLLTEARREARVRNGQLVPLGEQDRAGWHRGLIAEGHDLVRECLAINRPGRYQILAAINAVHTDAPTASDTDTRYPVHRLRRSDGGRKSRPCASETPARSKQRLTPADSLDHVESCMSMHSCVLPCVKGPPHHRHECASCRAGKRFSCARSPRSARITREVLEIPAAAPNGDSVSVVPPPDVTDSSRHGRAAPGRPSSRGSRRSLRASPGSRPLAVRDSAARGRTGGEVTAVFIKRGQDMLTERRRYISK